MPSDRYQLERQDISSGECHYSCMSVLMKLLYIAQADIGELARRK